MPLFEVMAPIGADQLALAEAIGEAVADATREGALRPNSVDPLTAVNSGDNRGPGTPLVHFEEWLSDDIEVRLLLKGGGCDNVSAQYDLPRDLPGLGRADRNLEGARKCVLHAVHQAQGHGCSVGILGVAIGGDRASGHDAGQAAALPAARRRPSRPGAGPLRARASSRRRTPWGSAPWASAAR